MKSVAIFGARGSVAVFHAGRLRAPPDNFKPFNTLTRQAVALTQAIGKSTEAFFQRATSKPVLQAGIDQMGFVILVSAESIVLGVGIPVLQRPADILGDPASERGGDGISFCAGTVGHAVE